jgi:hypothetical protein
MRSSETRGVSTWTSADNEVMERDDKNDDTTAESHNLNLEIMDTSDDRKPPAKLVSQGKQAAVPLSPDPKVKRKRRSPEKPWKKPADMPKRPLSAYNIFFRDERERLLSAGSEGKHGDDADKDVGSEPKAGAKKQKKPSGIGFANLAKTIAAKWKELDGEVRAPYEKIAAGEKKKYDELVAEWRIKQSAKKKSLAAAKKEGADERKTAPGREAHVPNLFSSERSLGSFSDSSNPYPSEWFHTAHEHETYEREDSSVARSSIPPVVDTSPEAAYERRVYDSSMASPAWQQYRHDHASYYHQQNYGVSEPYMRYSPERNAYLDQSLFSHDTSVQDSATPAAHSGYRDYYHHTQQSMHHHRGRHSDMRMSRAASLPLSRHGDQTQTHDAHHAYAQHQHLPHQQEMHQQDVYQQIHINVSQLRSARERSSRYHQYPSTTSRGSSQYARSASMPHTQHLSTPGEREDRRRRRIRGGEEIVDGSYRPSTEQVRPLTDPTASRRRTILNPDQIEAVVPHDESSVVETSLHSLTESLDEDAISFITSMKYS